MIAYVFYFLFVYDSNKIHKVHMVAYVFYFLFVYDSNKIKIHKVHMVAYVFYVFVYDSNRNSKYTDCGLNV